MRFTWGAASHRGLVRPNNQDAYLACPPIFLVADGMGGHDHGEVASALVAEHLKSLAGREDVHAEAVLDLLADANEAVVEHARRTSTARGMGTTACALVAVRNGASDELLALNVGDSRVYRRRDDRLVQVSRDHSAVQELLDAGRITAEEAAAHPERNVLTRAVGSDPRPQPDVWFLPPTGSERFVLCTDGLSRQIAHVELERLALAGAPQEAADLLVRAALEAGGRDNITVVVVDLTDGAPELGEEAEITAPRSAGDRSTSVARAALP